MREIKEELRQLWHDCNKIKVIVTTKKISFFISKGLYKLRITLNISREWNYRNPTSRIINTITKWYMKITLIINNEHYIKTIAFVDSGADQNAIKKELVLTKYYEKTTYT